MNVSIKTSVEFAGATPVQKHINHSVPTIDDKCSEEVPLRCNCVSRRTLSVPMKCKQLKRNNRSDETAEPSDLKKDCLRRYPFFKFVYRLKSASLSTFFVKYYI